jgi:uncharacterized membrane protein
MQNDPLSDQQSYNYQQPKYQVPQPYKTGKTQVLGLDYNIAGMLCYIPFGFIAAIIFLATEPKESRFVRFHAIQSLLLTVSIVVLSTVLNVLGQIMSNIPVIGWVFSLALIPVYLLISFGGLALMIVMIIKAYQNQMWRIPVIGSYTEKLL